MLKAVFVSIGLILLGVLSMLAQVTQTARPIQQKTQSPQQKPDSVKQIGPTAEQAAQLKAARSEFMIRAEEERRLRSLRAAEIQSGRLIREAAERDRRNVLERLAAVPRPKAAIMNVDVRAVFSRNEHNTFAEAQADAVNRIADGDPVWLYIKFSGKLGDYVYAEPNNEEPGKLRYMLFTEVGPQGDVTALAQYALRFNPSDLAATELRINLAPGVLGPARSIPVLLKTADSANPGVWPTEFRISNSPSVPRRTNDFVAKSPVILDLSDSHSKYRQMWAEYDSIMLRGTTDPLKLPVPGFFYNEAVKKEVVSKLKTAGIIPAKFYFSGDGWDEVVVSSYMLQDPAYSIKKKRRAFATYTYQKFGSCLYGVAEVTQTFDETASKFVTSSIDLANDFPLNCGLLK